MRRIGKILMGAPLAAGIALVACGTDDGSGFGNGNNGGGNGNGNGGGFGDGGIFGDGGSGGGQLAACATAQSGTSRLPVYLDIVLDGSKSMDGHGKPTGPVPCAASAANDPPTTNDGTCFLKDRRETDPLAPNRTKLECSQGGDSDQCPNAHFVGLTGKKWRAARGALTAYFNAQAPSTKLALGMFL